MIFENGIRFKELTDQKFTAWLSIYFEIEKVN
jgi:hypothetical protein